MSYKNTKKRILEALDEAKRNKEYHKIDRLKHLLKQLRKTK